MNCGMTNKADFSILCHFTALTGNDSVRFSWRTIFLNPLLYVLNICVRYNNHIHFGEEKGEVMYIRDVAVINGL